MRSGWTPAAYEATATAAMHDRGASHSVPRPVHISVVIPTYCRPDALRRCLQSLAQQDAAEPFEVVVVDDGSEPAVDVADVTPPDLRVTHVRQSNQGPAAARATGIRHAAGAILAFLDDDCTVPVDYLASIGRVFRAYPGTRVAQVGLEIGAPVGLYGRVWKFALEETLTENVVPAPDGRRLCHILGGVMVARREVFEEVAFDATLNRAREDADLRYQLHVHGVPVHYEPTIRVFHHCRQTLRNYLQQFFGYGRGEFHFKRKWNGTSPLPVRYVNLTSARSFKALVRSDGVVTAAQMFGVLWLRRHAGLWGLLYETARQNVEGAGRLRSRFLWLITSFYLRSLTRPAVVALTRRGR